MNNRLLTVEEVKQAIEIGCGEENNDNFYCPVGVAEESICKAQDAKTAKKFINFVNWLKRTELVSQDDWDLHCEKKWQTLKKLGS